MSVTTIISLHMLPNLNMQYYTISGHKVYNDLYLLNPIKENSSFSNIIDALQELLSERGKKMEFFISSNWLLIH